MKTATFYCRNSEIVPSNYYRLVQYIPYLNLVVKLRNSMPKRIYLLMRTHKNKSYPIALVVNIFSFFILYTRTLYYLVVDLISPPDYIFISKTLIPRVNSKIIEIIVAKLGTKSKIIWDFDDNILADKEISKKQFTLLEKVSFKIIVTNDYLNSLISNSKSVMLLPTTDLTLYNSEVESFNMARIQSLDETVKILWVGTSGNLIHLDLIISELDEAAKKIAIESGRKVRLTIISDGTYLPSVKKLEIINVKWSRQGAADEILKSHIGIMPLHDNEFTRGKGAFKLIQYLSGGLPVIGSHVGFNTNVVSKDVGFLIKNDELFRWKDAVLEIVKDGDSWKNFSKAANQKFTEDYSPERNIGELNDLIEVKNI